MDKSVPRSMLGDNALSSIILRKLECKNCGLVRAGYEFDAESLSNLYEFDYALNTNTDEYHFLTRQGAIPRSKVIFDWMWEYLKADKTEHFQKVLEIGCGAGHLLVRFQSAFPEAQCVGTEFSEAAREIAASKGSQVMAGGIEQVKGTGFDLIYALTVFEHVPYPGAFLKAIRNRLSPNGTLILIQPTQDVPSSDIYFADHLHHFGTDHLSMYAEKIGFNEAVKIVGHPLMPNFSFHLWRPTEPSTEYVRWGNTQCRESVALHEAMFEKVNHLVDEIQSDPTRSLAVFGLNERFALLRAYSRLGEAKIVCGLSDVEANVQVDFPVVKPERVKEFSATDVILCINQIHKDFVSERLSPLGVAVHAT
jgi:SAM-dependent methyltransferase